METPEPTNDNKGFDALERSVIELREAVSAKLERLRKCGRSICILLILVVVAMSIYLTFAYKKISEVDARLVASNLQFKLEQALPHASEELKDTLTTRAPEDVKRVIDHIRELPDWSERTLKAEFAESIGEEITKADMKVFPFLQAQVKIVFDQIKNDHPDKTPDERAELLLDEMAILYRMESIRAIDDLYKDIKPRSDEIVKYISDLGRNEGLTQLQSIERELFITLFALIEKWERRGTDTKSISPLHRKPAPDTPTKKKN